MGLHSPLRPPQYRYQVNITWSVWHGVGWFVGAKDDGPGVVFELFSSPACEDWTSLNMVAVTPLDVCTNGLQKWVCIDGTLGEMK